MVSFERSFKRDAEVPSKAPDTFFPHTLFLDGKEVGDLGLKDAEVGDKMVLISKVEVSSTSISENDKGKKRHSVQLRLLEGEIEKPKSNHAEKLFGSKG